MVAVAPKKRVHKEVTLELKYKALLELDKGKTNKEVALLFGIPPNTLFGKNINLKLLRLFKQAVFLTRELKQIRTNMSINKLFCNDSKEVVVKH